MAATTVGGVPCLPPPRPSPAVSDRPADPADPPQLGWIAREVEEEHPELAMVTVELPWVGLRRSPPWVRHRLGALSDQVRGAQALQTRQEDVPALHRAFFRQIGLDPDRDRTPIEQAIFLRLWQGGFVSSGMPEDALLIALVETGVGVWAVDAAPLDGPLGVRPSVAGEQLGSGRQATELAPGTLVVADASRPVATLFQPAPRPFAVSARTQRVVLFVLQVPGVSAVPVQDALWTCRSLLEIG